MLQIFMIKLGDMLIVDVWWRCSLYESIVSTIDQLWTQWCVTDEVNLLWVSIHYHPSLSPLNNI